MTNQKFSFSNKYKIFNKPFNDFVELKIKTFNYLNNEKNLFKEIKKIQSFWKSFSWYSVELTSLFWLKNSTLKFLMKKSKLLSFSKNILLTDCYFIIDYLDLLKNNYTYIESFLMDLQLHPIKKEFLKLDWILIRYLSFKNSLKLSKLKSKKSSFYLICSKINLNFKFILWNWFLFILNNIFLIKKYYFFIPWSDFSFINNTYLNSKIFNFSTADLKSTNIIVPLIKPKINFNFINFFIKLKLILGFNCSFYFFLESFFFKSLVNYNLPTLDNFLIYNYVQKNI